MWTALFELLATSTRTGIIPADAGEPRQRLPRAVALNRLTANTSIIVFSDLNLILNHFRSK
jgi:hypothetical protein